MTQQVRITRSCRRWNLDRDGGWSLLEHDRLYAVVEHIHDNYGHSWVCIALNNTIVQVDRQHVVFTDFSAN